MRSKLAFLVACCSVFWIGCAAANGNDSSGGTVTLDNPVPVLDSISPDAALVNQQTFTLTASGADFVAGSKIIFRGDEMDTTYVNDNTLTCRVEPAQTAAGSLNTSSAVVQVRVMNPSPGGGESQSLGFSLKEKPVFTNAEVISGSARAYWNGLAADGAGSLFAWYTDNNYEHWETGEKQAFVQVLRSDDQADSWSGPHTASLTGVNFEPFLACNNEGHLLMAVSGWTSWYARVHFKRSTNHGESWSAGKKVEPEPFSCEFGASPSPPTLCVSSSGCIHMAYSHSPEMQWPGAFYARSTDNGVSWKFIPAGLNQGDVFPIVAAHGEKVFLAYISHGPLDASTRFKYSCQFKRSLDEGRTWQERKQLSSGTGVSGYTRMDLAAGPDNAVAAAWIWQHSLVRFRTSADGGATWRAEKGFVAASGGKPGVLKLVYDDLGNLLVAWVEDGMIYMRRSINNGNTWSAPVAVSTQAVHPDSPIPFGLIVAADGKILVTWVKNQTIFLSRGAAE